MTSLPLSFRLNAPLAPALLAVLLAGCASIPDVGPKPTPRGPESIAAEQSLVSNSQAAWPTDSWWTAYGDPQLDALIAEGLSNSPDVTAAAARFRKAGGIAQQAGAALLPSLDAQGSVGLQRQSTNLGYPKEFTDILPQGWQDSGQVSLSLGYELDLWGKNRARLAAATSEERAAAIDARQAQLLLATGIASAYVDLARLYEERDVRQATLNVRTTTQKLVKDREANGLETRGSLRQSDSEVAAARVSLNSVDEAIELRRHEIAALIGAGPDRGLAITRPQLAPVAAQGLPAGVTTDLVGRRPDVAAARERVEAASSRIKVARAAFFPAIRLDAMIGLQALGLGNLIDSGSTFGSAGPAISLPIFHGGELQGGYRSTRAEYDEIVANYDKTVVTAYQQVADAVTSERMIAQRLVDARESVAASEEAYAIAKARYSGGLSGYLDVLVVEDRLLLRRVALADLESAARTAHIALIRALGGGFGTTTALETKDTPHG